MQADMAECGLACLAMIGEFHQLGGGLASLRRRYSVSARGTSLVQLMEIAADLGLKSRAIQVEPNELGGLQLPCVLHWEMNHYVVLTKVDSRGYTVLDPAKGRVRVSPDSFSKKFTGVALELSPIAGFASVKSVKGPGWRDVTGRIVGLRWSLVQVLGLALAAELIGLLVPFQIRWVVDDVLVSADTHLLAAIGIGLSVVVLVQGALNALRGWIVSWVGISFNAQWISNIFRHLLRLPMEYFERRHMGDVVSRFMSVKAVQTTLTGAFVEAVLNGLVGVLALGVMASLFSSPMAAIVVAGFLLYALFRIASFHILWRYTEEQLVYAARQQTELMESVRGVQTIKLMAGESIRCSRLDNATLAAARQDLRVQRISTVFTTVNQALFTLLRVGLITFGARLCLGGSFSAGMLVAFIAYADQFTSRAASLMDRFVDFRLLNLHAERIGDIVLTHTEDEGRPVPGITPRTSQISVKNISFRYSESDSFVFKNVTFTVFPGESVAIIGQSGCGKTTLAKVILGLLQSTEGSIAIGGVDIAKINMPAYRRMVASVMQDDHLFAGSIADNVAFFDITANSHDIESACRLAGIHDDIIAMPMGYETLVGDMGSSLSGGQKQRVLLARALYAQPQILVLDEATSHLDREREASINKAISGLKMTRLIIAHRESTISSADRIIDLSAKILS
ncbi:peptidase domain-containing ABC transporter [Rhodanobacter sp. OK091]|uniref:peptidase domain-containing ABC transporter n=1 Tax=Rhodanobacter sp. OK091 TaxID=1881037 RepID=UPI0009FA36B5|nr:peptidase domain-containing ABC transporter [Rhodanobacter sp. OK091]